MWTPQPVCLSLPTTLPLIRGGHTGRLEGGQCRLSAIYAGTQGLDCPAGTRRGRLRFRGAQTPHLKDRPWWTRDRSSPLKCGPRAGTCLPRSQGSTVSPPVLGRGEGDRTDKRLRDYPLPRLTQPLPAPQPRGPQPCPHCLPSSLPEPQGPAHLSFSPPHPCSLTGISPFVGENDRTTLMNIRNYNVAFEETTFLSLSREARGFLIKVLVQDQL